MTAEFRIPFLRDRRSCEEIRSLMSNRLDEELDDSTRRRVDRHVRFCPRCRRVLGNLRATIVGLANLRTPADDEDESGVAEMLQRAKRDSDGRCGSPSLVIRSRGRSQTGAGEPHEAVVELGVADTQTAQA